MRDSQTIDMPWVYFESTIVYTGKVHDEARNVGDTKCVCPIP